MLVHDRAAHLTHSKILELLKHSCKACIVDAVLRKPRAVSRVSSSGNETMRDQTHAGQLPVGLGLGLRLTIPSG